MPEFQLIAPETIEKIKKWARSWNGEKLLLYGPPGTGKSTIAREIAKEMEWELFEINASDQGKEINEIIENTKNSTLMGKRRLLVIDCIGQFSENEISKISKILENYPHPAIFIADRYESKLKQLNPIFIQIKIDERKIFAFLKELSEIKKAKISDLEIFEIAKNSNGDIRAALTDFESRGSKRDAEVDIFKALDGIFYSSFDKAREATRNLDMDPGFFLAWIAENIPYQTKDPAEIYNAYEKLSKADVISGRIKKQNWQLKKYSMDAVAGIQKGHKKFVPYKFPKAIIELSRSKGNRALLRSLALKIGKKLHISAKDTITMLPMMAKFINPEEFSIDENEMEILEKFKK